MAIVPGRGVGPPGGDGGDHRGSSTSRARKVTVRPMRSRSKKWGSVMVFSRYGSAACAGTCCGEGATDGTDRKSLSRVISALYGLASTSLETALAISAE